jgi:hypothetical protein
MKRLGPLLLLSTLMVLGLAIDARAMSAHVVQRTVASKYCIAPVVSPAKDHGFAYHRMPGRGGRRCDDPLTAQGGGGCSE